MNMALNGHQRDLVVFDGVIDHILTAMEKNRANAYIQQYGCGALMHLAVNTNQRALIVGGGGIDCIISAIEAQEANFEVQQYCRVALERLLS